MFQIVISRLFIGRFCFEMDHVFFVYVCRVIGMVFGKPVLLYGSGYGMGAKSLF
jgi:hypothetical protein